MSKAVIDISARQSEQESALPFAAIAGPEKPLDAEFGTGRMLADRYRAGRILLAGDAAHVHSPAGGQGMNIGIQDAVALGHALAAVLAGRADGSRLDEYARSRRPVAERVVALTDRMTRAATLRGRRARSLRNGVIGMIGRIPALRRQLAIELAELRYR